MAKHNETGKIGEKIAAKFLRKKAYKILDTNRRIERWEIDIIAQEKKERDFEEVKTRFSEDYGAPEEAITLQKQKYLIKAANLYALLEDYEGPLRFDIITVFLRKGKKAYINHIEDAFYYTTCLS